MELKQLWAVLARRWWLALLPALVALALALPSLPEAISPPISYSVTIRFTASQPPPAEDAGTFQDQSYIPWLASEYAVINLAAWMRTDSFAQEIAEALRAEGQAVDAAAIQGAIASDAARSIMTLYLSWPDQDAITSIAAAAITVLRERTGAYFPQFSAQKVEIRPLDSIVAALAPPSIMARLAPLLRILVGLAAGVGLAFLAEYLDPTLRNRHEVEALLGLPVLAEIPRHRM